MQTFELYGTAWAIYFALGLALMALVAIKTRKLHWNIKFSIISLLAVGAFTPDVVSNAETYAPLIITALLNAETEGASAIVGALIKLFAIWGISVFSFLAIRHFWMAKKPIEDQQVTK